MAITLPQFLEAMDNTWTVDYYSEDEGKLRVHYLSNANPGIEYSHTVFNDLSTLPKIGDIGRFGFLSSDMCTKLIGSP